MAIAYVVLLLYPFVRIIVVGFGLRPMTYLCSGSGSPERGEVSHLVEWVLNPVKTWLVTPTAFMPLLPTYILRAGCCCGPQGLQPGWCLPFSSSSVQGAFLYHEH